MLNGRLFKVLLISYPLFSEYSCLNMGLGSQTYVDDYATVYKRSTLETENCKVSIIIKN